MMSQLQQTVAIAGGGLAGLAAGSRSRMLGIVYSYLSGAFILAGEPRPISIQERERL